MPDRPVRLGMLTPSSNTVLEPVTARLVAGLPISIHVSRFRVTQIALSDTALGQFDQPGMLHAADLLADAKVDSIAWNGTSAAWLGFASDEALCAAVTARTGIPATTAVLSFRDLFRRDGIRRVGLVTPYTGDVQARIRANWEAAGFDCRAERHLDLSENFAFAGVTEDQLAAMAHAVAAEGAEAIAIVCTNLAGARIAPLLEAELGIPVYDSVAVTLWGALRAAGRDPSVVTGWGGLFAGSLARAAA